VTKWSRGGDLVEKRMRLGKRLLKKIGKPERGGEKNTKGETSKKRTNLKAQRKQQKPEKEKNRGKRKTTFRNPKGEGKVVLKAKMQKEKKKSCRPKTRLIFHGTSEGLSDEKRGGGL